MLSDDIRNTIMIGIQNDPKLEKFHGDEDPNSHIKGFVYIMELRCKINEMGSWKIEYTFLLLQIQIHTSLYTLQLLQTCITKNDNGNYLFM